MTLTNLPAICPPFRTLARTATLTTCSSLSSTRLAERRFRFSSSRTVIKQGRVLRASLFSQISKVFSSMGTELAPIDPPAGKQLATFAGGCFWGLELAMQRVAGVERTTVGYTQGQTKTPTYMEVCSGATGHTEAVQATYDQKAVGYDQLLEAFFEQTDPTTLNRQGGDSGTQYRSGIYYHSIEQKEAAIKAAEDVQTKLDQGQFRPTGGRKVVVEILPAGDYYLAEEYHQQYLEKGGRFNRPQSAEKGCKDTIRCYG